MDGSGMHLEVKLIGLPEKLDVGIKDWKKIKGGCLIFHMSNNLNYCFIEGGWTVIKWIKWSYF